MTGTKTNISEMTDAELETEISELLSKMEIAVFDCNYIDSQETVTEQLNAAQAELAERQRRQA